jgi:L-alanine-DL-glutamate epimerase-like enolase superfamily enzyme
VEGGELKLKITPRQWTMTAPFVTAGETVSEIDVLHIELSIDGITGRAETMGVDYLGETITSMKHELGRLSEATLASLNSADLQALLPPGGSRNGLDCALWDLRSKHTSKGIAALTGIPLKSVETLYTLSLDDPENMARCARDAAHLKHLKLKLNANDTLQCLEAVRGARPDASIVIDANGSWPESLLWTLGDDLQRLNVALLEQPLAPDQDFRLENLNYPVPLCADESCQASGDLERVANCYQAINIKLDKCGGLTDALRMRDWCRQYGKQVMVGNMLGSSLAMAPAMVVAQGATFVDLDGPLWQSSDVLPELQIIDGVIRPPATELWG